MTLQPIPLNFLIYEENSISILLVLATQDGYIWTGDRLKNWKVIGGKLHTEERLSHLRQIFAAHSFKFAMIKNKHPY